MARNVLNGLSFGISSHAAYVSDETAHEILQLWTFVVALAKKTIKLENAPPKNKVGSCPQTLYGNSKMAVKLLLARSGHGTDLLPAQH